MIFKVSPNRIITLGATMVLYLNGTSSSGKSSIAHEIQKQLIAPTIYFSIDTLLYALSPQVLESIQGKRPQTCPLNWNSIFMGYFECVRALDESGNFVIADCPVYSEGLFNMYKKSLYPLKNKYVVGVVCPLEVCMQREVDRKDRAIGIAKKQFTEIHSFINYDYRIDTNYNKPDVIANLIIECIK